MSLQFSGNDTLHSDGLHRNTGHLNNTTHNDTIESCKLFTDFDKFSFETKIVSISVGVVVLAINILAITVLRRAKKIPYASKFLCTGILLYDMSFVILSTIRKFIRDPTTNLAFQVVGSVAYHLSLISVTMMSVERFLLFYYPMRYLRIVTERLTRIVILSLWSLYIIAFAMVRYGVCYIYLDSIDVFVQAGACNQIIVTHLGICLLTTSSVASVCNWKVLRLIQSKKYRTTSGNISLSSTSVLLRYYKSTGLVVMCLIQLLVTSSAYGAILFAVRFLGLGVLHLRISFEIVSTINALIDPILYIMWFKECQMEGLKIAAIFNRKLYLKAEEMRMEIFDIVVSDSFVRSRSSETVV